MVADERELVSRLKSGNIRAFEEVYACYRARVFSVLLRLSGRRDVAEDLLQETFIKLARSAPMLADDTRIGAWLFTVARNAYLSHRRWALLDISRLLAFGADAALPRLPDEETEGARTVARLERALMSTSDAHREVLVLVGIEELDQEDVARMLGITHAALRKRLSRARAELEERMKKLERPVNDAVTRGAR